MVFEGISQRLTQAAFGSPFHGLCKLNKSSRYLEFFSLCLTALYAFIIAGSLPCMGYTVRTGFLGKERKLKDSYEAHCTWNATN